MQRDSDKHSPRVDDQLKHETDGLVKGSPVEERTEPRLQEPADEGDAGFGTADRPLVEGSGAGLGIPDDAAEARSRLASHLPGAVFPAVREQLVWAARDQHAPDDLVDALRGLRSGRQYRTIEEVWEDLGGEHEGHHAQP